MPRAIIRHCLHGVYGIRHNGQPGPHKARLLHGRRALPQLPRRGGRTWRFRLDAQRSGPSARIRLGVRLLNRTTRSVTLTQAGARLVDRLLPALRQVNEALDVVNGPDDSPTGTLRLNVPSIVARLILPPLIPAFLKAHPRIALEVHAEDTFVDVLAAGFDAGIRYDERLEQDMIAVPIGPRVQRFAAAAAPSYLSEHGRPEHPKDLLDHACIRHRFPSGATASWEFERDGEIVRIDPPARIISTMIDLELDAAVSGLGIICSFRRLSRPELCERCAGANPRRLGTGFSWTLPLLFEPDLCAGAAARLHRFSKGERG